MNTPVTVPALQARKAAGGKIAMLTAYDYPSAQLMDASGIDAILVGDSCAMVMMGRRDTLSITMDEMLHHVKMVTAGVQRALVVADMPFLSYHISPEEAVRNAGRLIAEGGAGAVKLEGPPEKRADAIRAIVNADIPVMGHLGLTPQSVHALGGYKVQGRTNEAARAIKEAAKGLEALGCFAIVLECIPAELAAEISRELSIPTIGIGAGAGCDGQILVMHDMLGWGHTKFAKTFMDVRGIMAQAFKNYVNEVKIAEFPGPEHQYGPPKKSAEHPASSKDIVEFLLSTDYSEW